MITLQTFEDDLDRWGGALERWPPDARREAEALLAGSARARALHGATTTMEVALSLSNFGGAYDAADFHRFAAVATLHPQDRPSLLRRTPPMLRRAGWGAAIAAALVLGILVGDIAPGGRDDGPDQVLASALGASVGTVDVD